MRILTLCYEYPPIGGGGGRMARNVAEALVARGHEVRVQTAWLRGLPHREIVGGVAVARSFAFRRRADFCTVPEMAGYLAGAAWPAVRQSLGWRPDVIHAHFAVPSGALAFACHLLSRVPYVLTVHLGDLPGGNPDQTDHLFRVLQPFIRPIWRRAAAVSASSSFAAGLAREAYGREAAVLPNGISMTGRPEAAAPPATPLRLVAIGRFNPQKNFPWMMEALGGVKEPWRLTLIGDGAQAAEIKNAAGAAGIADRVEFCGWVPEERMREVLAASDVLLAPSTSEGNPLAVIEALKQGVSLLASDTPGLSDLVEDGRNGFAVAVGDPEAFRRRLREMIGAPESVLRMKQHSLEMSSRFDIARVAGAFAELLAGAARSA